MYWAESNPTMLPDLLCPFSTPRSTSSTWILWASWGWTQTVFWATALGRSSAPTAQRPRSCCPVGTWLGRTTPSQLPSKVISPDLPAGVFTGGFYQSLLCQEATRGVEISYRNFLFFLFLPFTCSLLFLFDIVITWVMLSLSFQQIFNL